MLICQHVSVNYLFTSNLITAKLISFLVNSQYCTDAEVSNPQLYPTFARTKPTDSQISGSVVSILKLFHWNRVTFIHNEGDEYGIMADTIYKVR